MRCATKFGKTGWTGNTVVWLQDAEGNPLIKSGDPGRWHGMVWGPLVHFGMAWHGIAWYRVGAFGTLWHGMAWYGMDARQPPD